MKDTLTSDQSRGLLTRREVALLLRVGLDAVDRYVHDTRDPMPCLRFGRRFLFEPADVLKYCKRLAGQSLRRG